MKDLLIALGFLALIGLGITAIPIAAGVAGTLFGTVMGVGAALLALWAVVKGMRTKDTP